MTQFLHFIYASPSTMGPGTMQKLLYSRRADCLSMVAMSWKIDHGSLFHFRSCWSLGCCGPRMPHGSDLSPSRFLVGLIKSLCKVSHIFIFLFQFYTHVAGITCLIRLASPLTCQLDPVRIDGVRWVKRG